MQARDFLQSARRLLSAPSEANRRSAVGRAYLALLHEARAALERWGFPLPSDETLHHSVRDHFGACPSMDLLRVETALKQLQLQFLAADYDLTVALPFSDDASIQLAITLAEVTVQLLDQIDNDPLRKRTALAHFGPRFRNESFQEMNPCRLSPRRCS